MGNICTIFKIHIHIPNFKSFLSFQSMNKALCFERVLTLNMFLNFGLFFCKDVCLAISVFFSIKFRFFQRLTARKIVVLREF